MTDIGELEKKAWFRFFKLCYVTAYVISVCAVLFLSYDSSPSKKARLTERQTRRVLTKLEEAGEIRKSQSTGGRNRRNHYFIILTENPDVITGKELQGKNNSVIGDTKTLTPMSGALNRHRTVNKRWSDANALSHSPA